MKMKLAFIAVALIAICSAFATRNSAKHSKVNTFQYAVTAETGTSPVKYYVDQTQDLTGLSEGSHGFFVCNSGTIACTITVSTSTPDGTDAGGAYYTSTSTNITNVEDDNAATFHKN